MSARDYTAIFLGYVKAVNQKDVEKADRLTDEMMAVDCIAHWPGNEPQQGTAGQKAFMRELITNNKDLHLSVDDIGSDGDRLFIRGTITTNNPTTGNIETNAFLEIDRITDGKMAESWTLTALGKWD
jgi:predicted SnoaL-like aldol condensation-catalyzing enzyme